MDDAAAAALTEVRDERSGEAERCDDVRLELEVDRCVVEGDRPVMLETNSTKASGNSK